jgi:hypothetical protein
VRVPAPAGYISLLNARVHMLLLSINYAHLLVWSERQALNQANENYGIENTAESN